MLDTAVASIARLPAGDDYPLGNCKTRALTGAVFLTNTASRSEKRKLGLRCSAFGRHAAMGQLLVMLIVPPIVGVVTYIVIRRIWERDENGASEAVTRLDPSAATPAEGTSPDLGDM